MSADPPQGAGVWPSVPHAVSHQLVVEADDKGFNEVSLGLLVCGRHVGVGTDKRRRRADP